MTKNEKLTCPCCGKKVKPTHFACKSGSVGGKKNALNATPEKMRNLANIRWARIKGKAK